MEMKFSEKFKKNKGEAAAPEAAKDSGKKKHKPDPKKLVGTISKKHIKNGSYSMAMAAVFIVIVWYPGPRSRRGPASGWPP